MVSPSSRSRTPCTLLAALLLLGCNAAPPKPEAETAGAAPNESGSTAAEDTDLISGNQVTVPKVFKGLRLGMSAEEAKAIFPGMPEEDTIKVPAHPDVYFVADFGHDEQQIQRFYFSLPGPDAQGRIAEHWGRGLLAYELGKDMFLWFNPDAGLRASLKPGFGNDWDLEITAYLPYGKLLGEHGTKLAFENAGALIGATADEVRARYGDILVEKSIEDARADREKLERLMRDKLNAEPGGSQLSALGPPRPSMHLELPPTEFESFWTHINLSFGRAPGEDPAAPERVQRIWFSLPFEMRPVAQEEMRALFKAKWGEPTQVEDLGEPMWVYDSAQRVELKLNDITHAWDLGFEAKRPG